jgi:phosphatidylethanolamine/phosphatidyl-N-methylethanolamine N-methyltransferase
MVSRLQSFDREAWARHFRFFRLWLKKPREVGAILPSSPALAQAMAACIDAAAPGAVIEFGGGTGSITQALLRVVGPQSLYVIEREPSLSAMLQKRWPSLHVFCADVREVKTLAADSGVVRVKAVVSGLPLLSMDLKLRRQILRAAFDVLAPGGVFVQFTYGPNSPIPEPLCRRLGIVARRVKWVVSNVPPAAVWEYRRVSDHRAPHIG